MGRILSILFICTTFFAQATKIEYGYATVYSDEFKNSATASGDNYDPSKLTAAHKSLPFGTIIQVTNLDTKKSVKVKINDRGPFIKGYIVELSGAANKILNIKRKTKVKISIEKKAAYSENSELKVDTYYEKDKQNNIPDTYENNNNPFSETKNKTNNAPIEKSKNKDAEALDKTSLNHPKKESVDQKKIDKVTNNDLKILKTKGYKVYDLYKTSTFIPKSPGYGVQVGTFNQLHNVLKETAKLQENWFSNILLTRELIDNKLTYKVIIGPFEERASADSYKKNAAKKGVKGFVVAVQPTTQREVYQIKALRLDKKGFAVQVLSMTDADNVILEVEKLKDQWFKNILINVVKGEDGQPEYKILLGPFPERKIASSYKENLVKKGMNGFVVDLEKIK